MRLQEQWTPPSVVVTSHGGAWPIRCSTAAWHGRARPPAGGLPSPGVGRAMEKKVGGGGAASAVPRPPPACRTRRRGRPGTHIRRAHTHAHQARAWVCVCSAHRRCVCGSRKPAPRRGGPRPKTKRGARAGAGVHDPDASSALFAPSDAGRGRWPARPATARPSPCRGRSLDRHAHGGACGVVRAADVSPTARFCPPALIIPPPRSRLCAA